MLCKAQCIPNLYGCMHCSYKMYPNKLYLMLPMLTLHSVMPQKVWYVLVPVVLNIQLTC